MRKIFSSRRNALLSPRGLGAFAPALAVVLVALLLRAFFPDAFFAAVHPAIRAGDALAFGARVARASLFDAAALVRERDRLAEESLALSAENKTLAEKVASLSALLGDQRPAHPEDGLVLDVVARPPESPYDSLVVEGGAREGVTRGMEAFGALGVPLGTVESVTAHFARIRLFSAPGVSLSASAGAGKVPLTLIGRGAGAFSASAPRAAALSAGDIVYAPGPGARALGTITRVGGDAASPVETLFITPLANPFTLSSVVVRAGAPELSRALSCASSSP